ADGAVARPDERSHGSRGIPVSRHLRRHAIDIRRADRRPHARKLSRALRRGPPAARRVARADDAPGRDARLHRPEGDRARIGGAPHRGRLLESPAEGYAAPGGPDRHLWPEAGPWLARNASSLRFSLRVAVQHLPARGSAPRTDREPRVGGAPGGGQSREDRLPLLRRGSGHGQPRVLDELRRSLIAIAMARRARAETPVPFGPDMPPPLTPPPTAETPDDSVSPGGGR